MVHSEECTGYSSKLLLPALKVHTGSSLAAHTIHRRWRRAGRGLHRNRARRVGSILAAEMNHRDRMQTEVDWSPTASRMQTESFHSCTCQLRMTAVHNQQHFHTLSGRRTAAERHTLHHDFHHEKALID